MECPNCHRTGFASDELKAHLRERTVCAVPLTLRELADHAKFTTGWRGTPPPTPEETAAAQEARIADLERVIATYKAGGTPEPEEAPAEGVA